MEQLPNLSGLSHEEKDTIIHLLFDTVLALRQEVAALRAENAELKAAPVKGVVAWFHAASLICDGRGQHLQ